MNEFSYYTNKYFNLISFMTVTYVKFKVYPTTDTEFVSN
jgi:hypothetical protein